VAISSINASKPTLAITFSLGIELRVDYRDVC